MGKFIDLTGQKFGRLTVVERAKNDTKNNTQWLCQCECGNKVIIRRHHLISDNTNSCGCLQKQRVSETHFIHGHNSYHQSKTHKTWHSMLQRCNNPKCQEYKNYGGRGIKVCKAWMKFEGFLQDMGERPPNLTLDRKNNDGDYCKENCRWITNKEQQRNKRTNRAITIGDETKCVAGWCEELGLRYHTVITRLQRGWSDEEALEIVPRKRKTKRK